MLLSAPKEYKIEKYTTGIKMIEGSLKRELKYSKDLRKVDYLIELFKFRRELKIKLQQV